MPTPRIVFAGTPPVASQALTILLNAGVEVAGVITRPDAKTGRDQIITPSAVALLAQAEGLAILKTTRFDQAAREWIRSLDAQLGVIVAYGAILVNEDLRLLPFGWINLHFSLLPEYPGPAPVQHAILDGKLVSGVTIFRLDEGIDSGPLVLQKEFDITGDETAGELLSEMAQVGGLALVDVIKTVPDSLASATPQPKGAPISIAHKISRSMAKIDFTKTAIAAKRLVQAMNPEPVAFFTEGSNTVRVFSVSIPEDDIELEPGECQLVNNRALVGFTKGVLNLKIVQPAGKKPMSGPDWLRGKPNQKVFLD